MREENLPDENEEQKQSPEKQGNAEMEEHLVVSRGLWGRRLYPGHFNKCLVYAKD